MGAPDALPDVLRPGLRLVFCGTAAGTVSAEKHCYYAGPGNRFWWILAEAGLTPRQLAPSEFASLLDFDIGLTDLVKKQSGADADIDFHSQGPGLVQRIERHSPLYLCFNGKRAAQETLGRKELRYGLQRERLGSTRLFVVPSTSAAARRYWDRAPWDELARLARAGGHLREQVGI